MKKIIILISIFIFICGCSNISIFEPENIDKIVENKEIIKDLQR
jgi:hypothetical protein